MELTVVILAFVAGLAVRHLGYPPLLGYLAAGFVAHMLGLGDGEDMKPLADAGIVLLLFMIGLHLKGSELKPRYVWGSAILHMLIALPLTTAVIYAVGTIYQPLQFETAIEPWILAFALSFSSTVLAVKLFEERGESDSYYASIAIGILVVQDILAVIYLVASSGHYPSPWAILLLGLPILIPLSRRFLPLLGHGELLLLGGVIFAMGAAELFEALSLKGGLGAIVAGMLIGHGNRTKADELYKQLSGLKNLLLIGFFLQIGYYGFPKLELLAVAVVLGLLIVLRPLIYFALLTAFGLRARTAWLTGLSLFNYSEFGLIVAAIAAQSGMLGQEWITTLALAMALSFFVATPINKKAHELYRRHQKHLVIHERKERLPEEVIESLNGAKIAVLGMGRVGLGAYRSLADAGHTDIVGIEENYAHTKKLKADGVNCVHGDASDRDFWERTSLADCDLILVSLSNHREDLQIANLARDIGYQNVLSIATRFADEGPILERLNVAPYYRYADVGRDFAEHSLHKMQERMTSKADSQQGTAS